MIANHDTSVAVSKPLKSSLSLADQAYLAIRTMVLELELLPGQQILIHKLATQMRMSRTPIREAVARLCSEGLLEAVSPKRFVVAIPTAEAMVETYEIIAGIEGQAAKLAAERASDAMIEQMEEAVTAQVAALAANDYTGWHQADARFHDLLIESTGNRRMREVMRMFDAQIHRIRLAAFRLRPNPTQSVLDHRAVVEAIRARDGNKARMLHLEHRERTVHDMENLYREFLNLLQMQFVSQSAHAERDNGHEREAETSGRVG